MAVEGFDSVILKAYLECALFTLSEEDFAYDPEISDFEEASVAAALRSVTEFRLLAGCSYHLYDKYQMGLDLWYTRNGHGTGFWDRPEEYSDEDSRRFTKIAEGLGPEDCYVITDDNKLEVWLGSA